MIKCDGKQNRIVKTAFIILMIAVLMIVPPSPPAEALITEGVAATVFVVLIGLVASAAGLKIIYDNINSGSAESYWSGKYLEWQNSRVSSGVQPSVEPINTAVSSWLNGSALLPYPDAFGLQKIVLGASAFGAIKDFLQWLTISQGATDGTATDFQSSLYGQSLTYIGEIPVHGLPVNYRENDTYYYLFFSYNWNNVYLTIPADGDVFMAFSRQQNASNNSLVSYRQYRNDGSASGVGNVISGFRATQSEKIYYALSTITLSDLFPSGVNASSPGADWSQLRSIYTTSEIVSLLNGYISDGEYNVVDRGSSIKVLPDESVDQLKYPSLEGTDSIGIDTTIPWTGADSLEDVLVGSLTEVLENTATAEYSESQTLDVPATEIPAFDGSYPLTTPSLTNKFPFSIPFDIFRMASAFKAEPVTPVIDYDMDFGITVYHWHLDFSLFDDTAALLRRLELIGFVGALAYATKYLIHW